MDRAPPPGVRVSATLALASLASMATLVLQAPGTQVLIVSGIGGEARYSEAFVETGGAMASALRERFGVPDSAIIFLAEDPSHDPARISGRSTKEGVEQAFATLAARAGPDDQVLVLLIGHGAHSAGESRFNLPGRDLAASDYARLLQRFPTQRLAFVNAASASGDFVPALSAQGRVIVTATKSAAEGNETRFARYFVEAFARDGADADKDDAVSILEAFEYTRREVARSYERENRLLTEHAMLDDDGDGRGTATPGLAGEGSLAGMWRLVRGGAVLAAGGTDDPALAELQRARTVLDDRLRALRQRQRSMEPQAYERELEALLVEIAITDRAIRERGGRAQ